MAMFETVPNVIPVQTVLPYVVASIMLTKVTITPSLRNSKHDVI